MTNHLFESFKQHNKIQWKEQVIKDLKDKDFDEILLWRVDENVLVDAYYNQEDLVNTPTLSL